MNLLIVEDEVQLADALAEILQRNKYHVDTVYNGEDGLHYASTGIYDCIVLDIMLPILDGISVLRMLRKQKISTPVLLLTAKSDVADKINGLDSGADDYLTKPFVTGELLARIRALTRRTGEVAVDGLQFHNLRLDSELYPQLWTGTNQAEPERISNHGDFHEQPQADCFQGIFH